MDEEASASPAMVGPYRIERKLGRITEHVFALLEPVA